MSLPNGVTLALATTYAAADTVSAVTNASPAVATTSSSHGISTGNYLEVTSGWSRLNNRIVRAASASGTTVTYEGYDSSSTTTHPVGTGTGSVREITAWTQISQIMGASSTGGDMQFVQYSFLEQDFQSQLPTEASPVTITLDIADDPTLAGYQALDAAADARTPYALRMTMPDGSKIYLYGYISFNKVPVMNKGQVMTVRATFSLLNEPTRYTS